MNYFDLHCDTPYLCDLQNKAFGDETLAVSATGGQIFDDWRQVFAIWIDDGESDPFGAYTRMLTGFKAKLQNAPSNLTPLFAVEGGRVLEDDLTRLDTLKNDGVRMMTLTWNGENKIAGGCRSNGEFTAFGKAVVERMNQLEMVVDLSHINEKSFYPAAYLADRVIATHSDCRAVCDHPRNLRDDQLKLIGEKGGLIGLCFYPEFLGGDVFNKLYENVVHLLNLGLEDAIAIGSDFDGADMDERLRGIGDIPRLYEFLAERGITQSTLQKIFFDNAAKVY